MTILLVEDEPHTARTIERLLLELRPEARVVGWSQSVADTIAWLNRALSLDLILMDIHLTDGSSFEIFRHATVTCPVIFITAYDEHALEAFQVNGIDYLLKPISRESLRRGLEKFDTLQRHYYRPAADTLLHSLPDLTALLHTMQQLSTPSAYKTSWLVPFKTKLIPVAATDVAHFVIRNGVVGLTTLDGQHYTLDTTLDELEAQADPQQFFRINRQALLARASITALEPYYNGRMVVHVQPQPAAAELLIVPKPRVTELRHWVSGS